MEGADAKLITALIREHWGPRLLGILAGVAAYYLHKNNMIAMPVKAPDSYLSAVISLGGVLTGFMATLKALLYGMSDITYKRLKASGYLADLLSFLREALWGSVSMCVIALLAFYVSGSILLHAAVVGVSAFALGAVARIASITAQLLEQRPDP